MRSLLCLAVLAAAVAAPAAAQVPGPPSPPTAPRFDTTLPYGAKPSDLRHRLSATLADPTRAAPDPSAERRDALIGRLAPLVAEGRCEEARRIARDEGDRAVSRRIGEVCVQGQATEAPGTV